MHTTCISAIRLWLYGKTICANSNTFVVIDQKNDIGLCIQSLTAQDGVPSSPQCHFCVREQFSGCSKSKRLVLQCFQMRDFCHFWNPPLCSVCRFRVTTAAQCCSAVTTWGRSRLSQSWTSPSRASRGTSPLWNASGTWTREPPLKTATQPWTHCTRTASRRSWPLKMDVLAAKSANILAYCVI